MKKIIYLLFCMMFFTGCTVKYNLNISDNNIDESISISNKIDSDSESYYDNLSANAYSQYNDEGIKKYSVKKVKEIDKTIYTLKQNYNLKKFHQIRAFSECFTAANLVKTGEDNSYILQTSKGFKCMSYEYEKIDSYEVNITFDDNYSVITHNANKVNGNKYTWYINSNNSNNISISVEFEKKEIIKDEKKEEKSSTNILLLIFIIIGLIAIVVFIIIYALNLNQKRNQI